MPAGVYRLMFKDSELKKLIPSGLEIGTYATDIIKIVGSCRFYLVHLVSKKLLAVTFFVAINDGSMLLSCKTTLALGLIQPRSRLDYLPPPQSQLDNQLCRPSKEDRVNYGICTLVTTGGDHPKPTTRSVHSNPTIVNKQDVFKLINSKEQILAHYPNVIDVIGRFPGPPYSIQLDPSITPKQTPCHTVPVHLKDIFKQEIDEMLKAGIIKPVHEATPWINSFVLVESKDKLGNLNCT